MNSKMFQLNKEDGLKILKTLGFSIGSCVVLFLINLLPQVDLPVGFLFLVPVANTLLVALKKWLDDEKGNFLGISK